jgi:cobaltochelatase CobN
MDFVAELARRWVELARVPNADKRIALILANYPTRDGRIGNGVGLDTPAAALNILRALQAEGYPLAGAARQRHRADPRTARRRHQRPRQPRPAPCHQSLAWTTTRRCSSACPRPTARRAGTLGHADNDPMCRDGRLMIAGLRWA